MFIPQEVHERMFACCCKWMSVNKNMNKSDVDALGDSVAYVSVQVMVSSQPSYTYMWSDESALL